jgi:hypothetical protein
MDEGLENIVWRAKAARLLVRERMVCEELRRE